MTYTKCCKICHSEFTTEARNKLYCCEKCAQKAAKKAYRARQKKKQIQLNNCDDNQFESIIRQAYSLSQNVATMFLPKVCSCKDHDHVCEGELVVHHIDHNVFNTQVSNLCWVCEKAHNEIHNEEEDCSIRDELKAYLTIKEQAEKRIRNAQLRASK